jgi:hypothetical protein
MVSDEAQGPRDAAGTRALLWLGVIAGPFYLTVGVVQGLVRPGFSFARHPLSVLANGPGGWVQSANFVLSGVMVIAAAVGFGRVLGRRSRAVTWPLAGFGLAMLVASVFHADPVDGFPPGTPLGPPTTISPMGLTHFASGALGFVCLAVSCFCAAWMMRRRGAASLAAVSLFGGLSIVVGFFGGAAVPIGTWGIWYAVVVGWAWLAILSLRLRRLAPE